MLNPIEPLDGHIGQRTSDYHTKYCGKNFYAFRLTDDNRYEFLAEEGYFERSQFHNYDIQKDDDKYIREKIQSYLENKERFQETGQLTKKYGDTLEKQQFLDAFDGDVEGDNWCTSFESWEHEDFGEYFPLKDSYYRYNNDSMDIYCQEKPFFFIARTASYRWCTGGADGILMFYEPQNRIILFTLNFG